MISLCGEEVGVNAEDDGGTAEFESVKERLEELESRSAETHGGKCLRDNQSQSIGSVL